MLKREPVLDSCESPGISSATRCAERRVDTVGNPAQAEMQSYLHHVVARRRPLTRPEAGGHLSDEDELADIYG